MKHRDTYASRSSAAEKGTLIQDTVYSTATSGATYVVASNAGTETLTVSHILTDSMVMLYPFGAVRDLLTWYAKKPKPEEENTAKPKNRRVYFRCASKQR